MSAPPYSIGSDIWPGVSKLIEEMGELHQVLGKLIATGGEAQHWDGSNLRERLVEEMGDVRAALSFVAAVNDLDPDAIHRRHFTKSVLFNQWHSEQRGWVAPLDPETT